MNRLLSGLVLSWLTLAGVVAEPQQPVNPRPVERPSRTVEALLKKQQEATEAARRAAEGPVAPEPGGASTAPLPEKPTRPQVFRVRGEEIWQVARQAGWKFFPQGARGPLDGQGTMAEIQPGLPLSLVQGPVMTQRRTPAGWGVASQNRFFLFTDARGRAKSLSPGWTVRDVQLTGAPFQWISRPQPGGNSPSLAIQIAGGRGDRDSVVRLEAVVLQGPPDATDWREAFAKP